MRTFRFTKKGWLAVPLVAIALASFYYDSLVSGLLLITAIIFWECLKDSRYDTVGAVFFLLVMVASFSLLLWVLASAGNWLAIILVFCAAALGLAYRYIVDHLFKHEAKRSESEIPSENK